MKIFSIRPLYALLPLVLAGQAWFSATAQTSPNPNPQLVSKEVNARVEVLQKHIEFPLGFDELSFYNVDIKRTVEPTTYQIRVGGSSLATAETSLQLE